MPLDKGYTLPKSISCDDKLLFRAIANPLIPNNEDEELAVSSKIGSGKSDQVESSKPVNQPIYSTANYASTTHNERARQRMERVKMATTKREQARMEEQNRREVARITRKLIAEQEVRREAMVGLGDSLCILWSITDA